MIRALVVLGIVLSLALSHSQAGAAESPSQDAYQAWSQGRPDEAARSLAAQTHPTWSTWYDLGLALAAANHIGPARAALLKAIQAAPLQPQPRIALELLLEKPLPGGIGQTLGPLAYAGSGWIGLMLWGIIGILIGSITLHARSRNWRLGVAVVLILIATPGSVAAWLEHQALAPLVITTRAASLVDSTGTSLGALPAGEMLTRQAGESWGGRILVETSAGRRGWMAITAFNPSPQLNVDTQPP